MNLPLLRRRRRQEPITYMADCLTCGWRFVMRARTSTFRQVCDSSREHAVHRHHVMNLDHRVVKTEERR